MTNIESKKKPFYKRKGIIAAFLILFFLIIIAASGSKDENTSQNTSSENQTVQQEAIKITSAKLLDEYETNEIAANDKYKNARIQVTGAIYNISEDFGSGSISLTGNSEYSLTYVQCVFSSSADLATASQLKKGDVVTLEGIGSGKTFNVTMNRCKVIQ